MSEDASDIFISYAREDAEWVGALAAALEKSGWSVFWDRRVPAGRNWRTYLAAKLEKARCVLVVWSEHAVASDYVLAEADDGRERNALVPVLRQPVRPPFGFRHIHAADLSGWVAGSASQEFDLLLKDLGTLLATVPCRPQPPWRRPGEILRDVDASWCPELVVIPAGSFMMGSPETEEGRLDHEGPQRQVTLARAFAMGRYPVTRGQFASFVAATGHDMSGGAYAWTGRGWVLMADRGWRNPGFAQTDAHPVVCVSWLDAQVYVRWLAENTGQSYRLPSEAEWEYAARAGTATPFWTGATITTAQANYDGNYTYGPGAKGVSRQGTVAVDDASFPANPFGLDHMHGNVSEWVQDCYADSYAGAPLDGHLVVDRKDCRVRILRGGSWFDSPRDLRSAGRVRRAPEGRYGRSGFRVARLLIP